MNSWTVEIRSFVDTFETGKGSFNSAFSICMTVLIIIKTYNYSELQ